LAQARGKSKCFTLTFEAKELQQSLVSSFTETKVEMEYLAEVI
jgi:hypothetical protein